MNTTRTLTLGAAGLPEPARAGLARRPWWPWVRKAFWSVFFAVLASLLWHQAQAIDWRDVTAAVSALPAGVLLAAGALAAGSHLLYACFDLLGRRLTGHRLPTASVMAITFISYAFNLNMGSLIGAVASRYRLYGRMGLDAPTVTRVLLISMATNWLGYLLLGGLAFAFFPLALPAQWHVDPDWLQLGGALLAGLALAYLLACTLAQGRTWSVRGHAFSLPGPRIALLQLAMSCANWALIGAVLHVLLQQQLPYTSVLPVLLLAAVAGVVTHVPAGLGVLEAVFVALLGAQLPPATLIGTLLAYRVLYYLVPLAVAAVLFMVLEARHKRSEGHAR